MRASVSARELAEWGAREGDIGGDFVPPFRLVEGTRAHQQVRKRAPGDYAFEVPLRTLFLFDMCELTVTGRADAVFPDEEGVGVEEIKSSVRFPDSFDSSPRAHQAQALIYADMLLKDTGGRRAVVRLNYVYPSGREGVSFERVFTREEVLLFVSDLAGRYARWMALLNENDGKRDASIAKLTFPYPNYRPGQRAFASAVYAAASDGGSVCIQAPTGTGKTIAALFPALKALGQGKIEKIFYLTSRTTGRATAQDAVHRLYEKGLSLRFITITARQKICPTPGTPCHPGFCPRARGYMERLQDALEQSMEFDLLDPERIERLADRFTLCPYELSLDLSLTCCLILCDYNYAFDPKVFLRRYFFDGGKYLLLCDEAHSLVDRAREMFSASLRKKDALALLRALALLLPKEHPLLKTVKELNKQLRAVGQLARLESEETPTLLPAPPDNVLIALSAFMEEASAALSAPNPPAPEQLSDLFFGGQFFTRLSDQFAENSAVYADPSGRDVHLRIACLDPAPPLKKTLEKVRGAVFFSATLSPPEYFTRMLGGQPEDFIALPSPFPQDNLCVLLGKYIDTRYKMRAQSYGSVAAAILQFVSAKRGNYLVFFPSYGYLREVFPLLSAGPGMRVITQRSGMDDRAREEFLSAFRERAAGTLLGLAVMGGAFAESIDLPGEMLSGAVIVGIGLPQINFELELLRRHFDRAQEPGFHFAYSYPGFAKVMQAVGRVIRTEEDRGAALLLDNRFASEFYLRMMPYWWFPVYPACAHEEIGTLIRAFWKGEMPEPISVAPDEDWEPR